MKHIAITMCYSRLSWQVDSSFVYYLGCSLLSSSFEYSDLKSIISCNNNVHFIGNVHIFSIPYGLANNNRSSLRRVHGTHSFTPSHRCPPHIHPCRGSIVRSVWKYTQFHEQRSNTHVNGQTATQVWHHINLAHLAFVCRMWLK